MALYGKRPSEALSFYNIHNRIRQSTLIPIIDRFGALESADLDITIEFLVVSDLLISHPRNLFGLYVQVLVDGLICLETVVHPLQVLLLSSPLLPLKVVISFIFILLEVLEVPVLIIIIASEYDLLPSLVQELLPLELSNELLPVLLILLLI